MPTGRESHAVLTTIVCTHDLVHFTCPSCSYITVFPSSPSCCSHLPAFLSPPTFVGVKLFWHLLQLGSNCKMASKLSRLAGPSTSWPNIELILRIDFLNVSKNDQPPSFQKPLGNTYYLRACLCDSSIRQGHVCNSG